MNIFQGEFYPVSEGADFTILPSGAKRIRDNGALPFAFFWESSIIPLQLQSIAKKWHRANRSSETGILDWIMMNMIPVPRP